MIWLLFVLFISVVPPGWTWDPDVVKLTEAEIAMIHKKCYSKGTLAGEALTPSKKSAAPDRVYRFSAFIGHENQFRCGAVFITPRHLLTVRDCLRETNAEGLSLFVGGMCYGEKSGQCGGKVDMRRLEIDSAIYDNEEWGSDTRDLAILQITDTLAETVAPVIDIACLPDVDAHFPTSAVVVGWGRMGLSMPPYYLQHAPVELDSDDGDNTFLSIITYARQNRSKAVDTNGIREFDQTGRNSSAGNAVVSYSSASGRYVLHGLLLGSSWAGRFGRVVSDGVKVTPFYSELCNLLQVCGPRFVHPSAAPELHLTPHRVIPESVRNVFPRRHEQDSDVDDYASEKICDRRGVSVDDIFQENPLATIDVESGAVTLKQGPNQPEKVSVLQFDIRSVFDGSDSSRGKAQLTIKVCISEDDHWPSEIELCWNTPYAPSNEPVGARRSTFFAETDFKHCHDYNYGIKFSRYVTTIKNNLIIQFKHSIGAFAGFEVECECNPCCEFPLVDSPRFSNPNYPDRYLGEYIENWDARDKKWGKVKDDNFRLPMIKLDKGYNVDSLKIKVTAFETSKEQSPTVKIYGDQACACYYQWETTGRNLCDAGVGDDVCALWYSVDKSEVTKNKHISTSVTETGETVSSSEALEIAKEAVAIAVSEVITEKVNELEASIQTTIKTESKVELEVFSAKVSTELSAKMGSKVTDSTTNSMKESFENASENKTKTELKNKKALVTNIESKHEEINTETIQEHNKVYRMIKAKKGQPQQLCQLTHVCHGRVIDTSITNIFSRAKNSQN